MDRKIVGFHQDNQGDWVAELECGHTIHVRHRPPMSNRPWVVTRRGRERFLGSSLDCAACRATPESNSSDEQRDLQVATAVRAACLQAALENYEYAAIKGLCHEGAWECAIDAIKHLDISQILGSLPAKK